MAIVIQYKQILIRGVKKIKILDVNALSEKELPEEYTDPKGKADYVIMLFNKKSNKRGLFIHDMEYLGGDRLMVNDIIDVDQWNRYRKTIARAGDRLCEIHKSLAIENNGWKGVIVEERF